MKLSNLTTTIVLLGAFIGSFLSIRPTANAQEASPFPLIGGVSLGRVEYLTFETKPDRKFKNG